MNLKYESKIKIPNEIITYEEFINMNRRNRRFYVTNLIKTILKLNSKSEYGMTLKDLHDIINFISLVTLKRYIDNLIASADIYCLKGRPLRYFINGRISHSIPGGSFQLGNCIYELNLIANNLSELLSPIIFIQESKIDEFDEIEKKGSLMIKGEDFEDFIYHLQAHLPKIRDYLKNFNNKIYEVID